MDYRVRADPAGCGGCAAYEGNTVCQGCRGCRGCHVIWTIEDRVDVWLVANVLHIEACWKSHVEDSSRGYPVGNRALSI